MAERTEHEAIARSSIASALAFDPSRTGQVVLVPEGFDLAIPEAAQLAPNRARADEKFVDVTSLAEYVNRFAGPGTMISADYKAEKIAAVIDGHSPEGPGHREHRATFSAERHDKIKAWLSICDKPLGQVDFGLFLEDRAVDVVAPEAASVMEMVMTFDATKKVSFRSSTRLHDGARQFQYVEENETKGAVTLPDHFIVLTPIYRGMEPERIKFMVRYRIEDAKLRFIVQMHDKDTVMRGAFDRCVDALRTSLAGDQFIYVTG